jgi:hypothetical protein
LPLIAAALIFGCDQDSSSDDSGPDPASLTITEVTELYVQGGTNGILVGVFPKNYSASGTASIVITNSALQAGAVWSPLGYTQGVGSNSITITPPKTQGGSYSITADLYAKAGSFSTRWTADDDYAVILVLTDTGNVKSYLRSTGNIHINGSVTVPAGSFGNFY